MPFFRLLIAEGETPEIETCSQLRSQTRWYQRRVSSTMRTTESLTDTFNGTASWAPPSDGARYAGSQWRQRFGLRRRRFELSENRLYGVEPGRERVGITFERVEQADVPDH
jgi:hypothetical protein